MITGQWYIGLVIAALATNVLLAYQAYRLRRQGTRTVDSGALSPGEELIDRSAGVVECAECGTDNELGYRYCRSCVEELPMSMPFRGTGDSPLGRLTG